MVKSYVTREVRPEDWKIIEKMIRQNESIIVSPSNINDIYDAQRYREENISYNLELKAVLDNNIFTQVLPLLDGRKKYGEPLNEEVKLICGIMCFLKYSGIETNPTLALLERKEVDSISKNQEDYYFRVADHLHPQIFADLALGTICDISRKELDPIKNYLNSDHVIQKEINQTYKIMEESQEFQVTYSGVLKSILLYKKESDELARLRLFLNWYYNSSLLGLELFYFTVIFLSNKRIPKMIKKINSSSYEVIIKSILNAVWDLKYLSILYELHQNTPENEIWFLCSRDKVLLKLSKYTFAFTSEKDIHDFIGEYYPKNKKKAIELIDEYLRKKEQRENTVEGNKHKEKILMELGISISSLEQELKVI